MDAAYIDALERELAGYIASGKTARAAAVRAELVRAGRKWAPEIEAAVEPAEVETATLPKSRRSR